MELSWTIPGADLACVSPKAEQRVAPRGARDSTLSLQDVPSARAFPWLLADAGGLAGAPWRETIFTLSAHYVRARD